MWTAITALIGAVVGTIGSQLVRYWLTERSTMNAEQSRVMEQYLLTLQDALASLWYRIYNIDRNFGMVVMEAEYYRGSSLYALGTLFAIKRLLLLDGVYGQLQNLHNRRRRVVPLGSAMSRQEIGSLAEVLWRWLDEIEDLLDCEGFQRYQHLALGEAAIEPTAQGFRLRRYTDFLSELPPFGTGPFAAADNVLRLIGSTAFNTVSEEVRDDARLYRGRLLEKLGEVGQGLARETGIRWKPAKSDWASANELTARNNRPRSRRRPPRSEATDGPGMS